MGDTKPEQPSCVELQNRIQELETNQIALEKTKDELAQLFSMLLDPVCIADLQTANFIKVNQAFTTTLGYSPEELVGRRVFEFIHPDDRQATVSVIEKKLKKGDQVINFENRYRCRDGTYRWLSWVARPNVDEGISYAVARDISQVKEAENKLRESEKKYRGLFNSTNDGICLHELVYNGNEPVDYRILDVNPKYETLTGIKAGEAIGALASDLYQTEKAPFFETFVEVSRTGKSVSFETYFQPMDKHFLVSAFSPEPDQFATVFQDITERKRTENALKESESRYRSLFHNNHAVMLLIDPDSGQIVDANPAALSYYEYAYNEIVDKRIWDFNILPKVQVIQEMERARKETRRVFNFQHRLADGDIRDVEVYSGPIVIRGRQLLYSIVHDVTTRTMVEKETDNLIKELQIALKEIKTLRGILPICSSCKKIRDDKGYWNRLEAYIYEHTDAQFSHGFCPDCMKKLYPDFVDDDDENPPRD